MVFRCVVLSFLLAGCVLAADDAASLAQDPYHLAQFINSHPRVDLTTVRVALRMDDPAVLGQSCEEGDCHAEVIEVTGSKPAQVILWNSYKLRKTAFWLRYQREPGAPWGFVSGNRVTGRIFDPERRLVTAFGKQFFVVTGLGLAGAGLSSKVESWFDLSLPRSQAVLAFTSEGNRIGPAPYLVHGVNASASVVQRGASQVIRVEYAASFGTDSNEGRQPALRLADSHATADYVPQPDGRFKPDPRASQEFARNGHAASGGAERGSTSVDAAAGGQRASVTKSVIDSVFDIQEDDRVTNEAFLKFELAELRIIASAHGSPAAQWLASFLQVCKDSPEKKELLRLLQ